MASIGRRVLVYLGLVDDDYEEYEPYEEAAAPVAPVGRRPTAMVQVPEPEVSGVRTLPRDDPAIAAGLQPRPAVVRPITPVHSAKVHVVAPVGFDDAKEIGDKLRSNEPVILNLQGSHRELRRRLIDFASGLTYGLGGTMERVAEQVFLLTPSNVEVSAEEKRRLQERGLIGS